MKLQPISTHHLTHLETGQFIAHQLTGIRALGDEDFFTDTILNNFIMALESSQNAFDNAVLTVRKNDESVRIQAQDNERDQALSFLKKALDMYELSDIAEERNAATSLLTLFATYKNLANLNYMAETHGIENLLSDLGNNKYEPMVDFLNLDRHKNRLQESNEAFKELLNGRSQETAQQESFDAQSLKKQMLVVYNDFAGYVLTMAKVMPGNDLYTRCLNVLNNSRKYFADMLARRKGVAAEAPV